MRKTLLVLLIILFSSDAVFCNEFEDTLKKAEQGHADAQFDLGVMYYVGEIISHDFQQAISWWSKAAKQGHASAQYSLALIYDYGQGVFDQDHNQAVHWYTRAAERGHASAQHNLGVMYSEGEGVPQDYKQALYWYTKAAEQGDNWAQLNLGGIFFMGQGVPKDYKKAFYWYSKAAEQGYASAQLNLGWMYENGKGVSQGDKQALYWYTKAAEQGDATAQHNLDTFGEGYAIIRLMISKQAAYWYTKSAEQGVANAQNTLGVMYYTGQGVTNQDYNQAVYWYTKAAEQGHAAAQLNLGGMYAQGQGVTQDYRQAVHWCTNAAVQGYADAQFELGIMYLDGWGVTQNFKLAYVWLSLASAQRHEKAIKNRGIAGAKLTPQEISEAQDLAAKIQHQIDSPAGPLTQPPTKTDSNKVIGTGTGFFITRDGYILTCLHVVQDAARIEIYVGNKMYPASLVQEDPNNDLAVLKINGSFPAIAFSPNRSARIGEDVFTVGYPNPGLQGVSVKYTKGTISSLTGIQDDLRFYQISVPVQPGNSGGALLDENGNVLGIVIAMLNAKTTFEMSGSLPQNVNYAVKSLYAQAMIDMLPDVAGNLVPPSRSKSDAIEKAQNSTAMVVCYD